MFIQGFLSSFVLSNSDSPFFVKQILIHEYCCFRNLFLNLCKSLFLLQFRWSPVPIHVNNIVTDCEREVGGRPSPAIFLLSRSSSPNRCLAYLHIFIHLSLTSVALFVFLTPFTFSVMLFLLISEAIIKITFNDRVCLNFVLNNVYIDYNYAEMLTSCPLWLWAEIEVLPFYTGIKHAWVVNSVI